MTEVVAVVGPTASGKTALALALAEALDTEIVSADSMQFYRGMEIGTGQPPAVELARVKHHFIGFLNPDEPMSAGRYQELARQVVADLNARGKPAVAVGGSGLYIRALIDGLFSGPAKDEALRTRLAEEAEAQGVDALYQRLMDADPDYANTIHSTDLRRIIRGLEVYELTGSPMSFLHGLDAAEPQPLDAVQIALDWPRERLYERINARVDRMIEQGLVAEVQRLLDQGYREDLLRLKSLGYPELVGYLDGEFSLEHAVGRMKTLTRRYARRQISWFKQDTRIQWIPVNGDESEVFLVKQARNAINSHQNGAIGHA